MKAKLLKILRKHWEYVYLGNYNCVFRNKKTNLVITADNREDYYIFLYGMFNARFESWEAAVKRIRKKEKKKKQAELLRRFFNTSTIK